MSFSTNLPKADVGKAKFSAQGRFRFRPHKVVQRLPRESGRYARNPRE